MLQKNDPHTVALKVETKHFIMHILETTFLENIHFTERKKPFTKCISEGQHFIP